MSPALTEDQANSRHAFEEFVTSKIAPFADLYDREERITQEAIEAMAKEGYLGAVVAKEYGGTAMDMVTFGLLNEEVGRGCSSLRSLLTVHCMVAHSLNRWGSKLQKQFWLPKLATGEKIAAFALTEPLAGSDAASIESTATLSDSTYILNGQKKWITFGQIADLFLIFALCDSRPAAFLVERDSPGLSIKPISGMLGMKASMLAELTLNDCRIEKHNLVGRAGFGLSAVAYSALDYGRYTVAWGCVGIARACLEACVRYANQRKQFGRHLKDYQLVRQMITNMVINYKAARLLCYEAGLLKDAGDPASIMETSIAKYFASRTATRAALDAVQIHGAAGCSSEFPVQRYLRDAKIMEIIEGSSQIHQVSIAEFAFQEYSLP